MMQGQTIALLFCRVKLSKENGIKSEEQQNLILSPLYELSWLGQNPLVCIKT